MQEGAERCVLIFYFVFFFLVLKICSFLSRVRFFKPVAIFFIPTEIIPICKSFEHLKPF
jgi:hypothetical protein